MVEAGFQIVSAPTSVKPSEECPRGGKIASNMDWRCWRREVHLTELDSHVLKMRIPVRSAKEPRVSETGGITGILSSRCDGISRPDYEAEHEREGFDLPAHRATPLLVNGFAAI